MASLLFLFSLFLTLTTATTATNSTTPTSNATSTTTNSTTSTINTTTNTTVIPSTAQLTPFNPPPQPQPTSQQEAHFNTIIDAIISAGDFSNWANLLATADPSVIPISATIFVPDDDAFLDSSVRSPPATPLNFLDPLLFPYHIIPRRFVFSELLQFPTGARLPTLLPSNTLLITNNSAVNFTVEGAKVTRPDLYQNPLVTVHGVGGVLDYTVFGNDDQPQQNNTNVENSDQDEEDDDDIEEEVVDPVTEFDVSGAEAEDKPATPPVVVQVSAASVAPSCSWVKVAVVIVLSFYLLRLLGVLELNVELTSFNDL